MEQYGADILRLWVASEDSTADLSVGDNILKAVSENYRRIRNSLRWLLGSLSDFDPSKDAVPLAALQPFDRWLLAKTAGLIDGVTQSMQAYELHKAFGQIQSFCSSELSSLAFDVHKDTLYTLRMSDPKRRSAQTAFHHVLQALLRLCAPVLVFTSEEAWEQLPASQRPGKSVHFSAWPKAEPAWREAELEEDFAILLDTVRPVVTKQIEALRAAKTIGHPYDSEVALSVRSKKLLRLLNKHKDFLPALFIVSKVSLGNAAPQDGLQFTPEEVQVQHNGAHKCARCWRRPGDVGAEGGICGRCSAAIA